LTFVRYVALASLVLWLGVLADALGGDRLRHVHVASAVCGALILAALLAMKFIGPPPRAFVVRTAMVVAMMAMMGYTALRATASPAMLAATTALGFGLLAWYTRES
jgi:hypothetical protein